MIIGSQTFQLLTLKPNFLTTKAIKMLVDIFKWT